MVASNDEISIDIRNKDNLKRERSENPQLGGFLSGKVFGDKAYFGFE